MYDLRMPPASEICSLLLPVFKGDVSDAETTSVLFSPDGTLFFIGRIDNQVNAWDTRFIRADHSPYGTLSHGRPLNALAHWTPETEDSPPKNVEFGIAKDRVDNRHGLGVGSGLVTGGADGQLNSPFLILNV